MFEKNNTHFALQTELSKKRYSQVLNMHTGSLLGAWMEMGCFHVLLYMSIFLVLGFYCGPQNHCTFRVSYIYECILILSLFKSEYLRGWLDHTTPTKATSSTISLISLNYVDWIFQRTTLKVHLFKSRHVIDLEIRFLLKSWVWNLTRRCYQFFWSQYIRSFALALIGLLNSHD